MNLETPEIRTIVTGDKKYYSVTDSIKLFAPGRLWDGKDQVIYLDSGDLREPYSDEETLMNILKRLEQPPELSPFDKMLKGVMRVPKPKN